MAGSPRPPWYVKATLELIGFMLASLAAMMALRLGGVIGWTGFALGVFAMYELALWADWQWPEMRS
ncbi:MAG: hypothetical protein AMJ77_04285 [Dehalococcoidia bacterium SM23_28_2]|nr:MAG: hypothetical protein AMJ77_04285 [Dehalococcoidia bacterium SM23_28_2]